jgi:Family of unknown function (DUF6074)
MSSPATDPHSGWLNQVALDFSLTAVTQVIATVLVDFAGPGTNIARVGPASLAKPTGIALSEVIEALSQLVDRGHLRSLSRRGNAGAYQLIQRARPITRRTRAPLPPLQVYPFPPASRSALVREIVAEMLVRPQQAAETWLKAELGRQRSALRRAGFAKPVIAREVEALEVAVRRGVWRAVLVPDEPA